MLIEDEAILWIQCHMGRRGVERQRVREETSRVREDQANTGEGRSI